MLAKLLCVVSCLAFSLFEISGAPIDYNSNIPFQVIPLRMLFPQGYPAEIPQTNPKFVWNFVGDLITGSGFLPIEVNVPSTVASVAGGAQNLVQSLTMAAANLIQRIPFVTRLTSPETPRPLKVMVVDQNGQVIGMMNNGLY